MERPGECVCHEVPGDEACAVTMFRVHIEKYKMTCLRNHILERHCSTPLPTTSLVVESSRKHVQEWTTSNFHIDNFAIVDKIIEYACTTLRPEPHLRDELCSLNSHMFRSYSYAINARQGGADSKGH